MADDEPTNTAPTPDASSSFGQLDQQLRTAMEDTCEQLGIPKEYAQQILGMLGINTKALELVMNVMQNFGANGVQGVGGEIPDGTAVAYSGPDTPAQNVGISTPQMS